MSRSHHPNNRRARAWGTRLFALLAVFLQVFVVPTHVHALSHAAPAGYSQTAHATASALDPATHEGQISCALCQAQHASNALPPGADALVVVDASHVINTALRIQRVSVARAYSWQSRAPPLAL